MAARLEELLADLQMYTRRVQKLVAAEKSSESAPARKRLIAEGTDLSIELDCLELSERARKDRRNALRILHELDLILKE